MADIRHRVGISASQERVFAALSTKGGLADWWTRDVEGEATPGSTLRFFFGTPDPSGVMEVVNTTPIHRVSWRCVAGPDDWVGTSLNFELKPSEKEEAHENGNETVLLFTHGEWREPTEFMHHCSTKWAYFLLGLKASLEGGASVAFPNDMPISSWG
jgi:uncharacterized protein YndB with AHSA1/START domain